MINKIINYGGNEMELMKKDVRVTSNEIAELTGKQHKIVMRDIRSLVDSVGVQEIGTDVYPSTYTDKNNRLKPNYTLTKDGLMLMVTGYSVSHRLKLIKYCGELEKKLNNVELPRTYIDAVASLLDTLREKEALELQAIDDKPKVQYHDSILVSNGQFTSTQVASSINITGIKSAQALNKTLNDLKVIKKVNGSWVMRSKYAGNGYEATTIHQLDSDRTVQGIKWTEKGRKFIYETLKAVGYKDATPKVPNLN